MNNKIFILNAPPRTGKDTVATETQYMVNVHQAEFKTPMYAVFTTITGMPYEEFKRNYDRDEWKDTPHKYLNGKTPRELLIHISENCIKPFFGKQYYGEQLVRTIKAQEKCEGELNWIVPDGGFQEEYDTVKQAFGNRVVLISLEREGHRDFAGDSRNWVYDWEKYPEKGSAHFDTTNGNKEVVEFILNSINE